VVQTKHRLEFRLGLLTQLRLVAVAHKAQLVLTVLLLEQILQRLLQQVAVVAAMLALRVCQPPEERVVLVAVVARLKVAVAVMVVLLQHLQHKVMLAALERLEVMVAEAAGLEAQEVLELQV
jgi:hypothetical protein